LNYPLEKLSRQSFELVVLEICRSIFEGDIQHFRSGASEFHIGTFRKFPNAESSWQGRILIEAKFSTRPVSSIGDPDFFKRDKSTVKKEIKKIKRLQSEFPVEGYLLFTNRIAPAKTVQEIVSYISKETHLKQVMIIGRHQLNAFLDQLPQLVSQFIVDDPNEGVHNLPSRRASPHFVGREAELKRIDQEFDAPNSPIAVVITGVGGVGKTALAKEYANQTKSKYQHSFFIQGSTPDIFNSQLASLSDQLSLPSVQDQKPHFHKVIDGFQPSKKIFRSGTQDPKARLNQAFDKLRLLKNWLLIIDDADTDIMQTEITSTLSRFDGSGRFLITSRMASWPEEFPIIQLHSLRRSESIAFLASKLGLKHDQASQPAIQRLAELLADFPLGMHLAAAFIDKQNISVEAFLDMWEKSKTESFSSALADVLKKNFSTLSSPARFVISICSHLGMAPIPRSLLNHLKDLINKEEKEQSIEPLAIEDALDELSTYGLISLEPDIFLLHDLLIKILREDSNSETLQIALNWLASFVPKHSEDVRTWPIWESIKPHVQELISQGEEAGIPHPTIQLANMLGLFLLNKGQFKAAEIFFRKSLKLFDEHHVPQPLERSSILTNLGFILRETNRLSEAEPLMREDLQIIQKYLGEDHPRLATSLNNLAFLLRDLGRLNEAEPLLRRALDIDQSRFGPDSSEIATDLNNLALLLTETGRLSEAELFLRKALEISKTHLGTEHPATAIQLSNLAQLLQATGQLDQSEQLMQQALSIDEASFGPDHPNVAIKLNNLAQLSLQLGRLEEAKHWFERALSVLQTSYGNGHPKTEAVAKQLYKLTGEDRSSTMIPQKG
jgi:tetratricopeptide (TPR) repeat protein